MKAIFEPPAKQYLIQIFTFKQSSIEKASNFLKGKLNTTL